MSIFFKKKAAERKAELHPKASEHTIFDGLELIIDVHGRPMFVVPVNLPAEGCRVCVTDDALDFMAGSQLVGHIEDINKALLLLVAQQKEVGIISWPSEETPCPDHLTHIATVQDNRKI